MFLTTISNTAPKNRVAAKEQNTFIKKLGKYLHQEIHVKIEHDDVPLNYILKEVGKNYIVVRFAHMERTIPIERIIYFQFETITAAPSSPI